MALPLLEGEEVTSVAAGFYHSLVTTSHGRVLGFGDNTHGQLGKGRQSGFTYQLLQEAESGVRIEEVPTPQP